jgi:hypothetical protein
VGCLFGGLSKDWVPHMCVMPKFHVPLTTRVPKSLVLLNANKAPMSPNRTSAREGEESAGRGEKFGVTHEDPEPERQVQAQVGLLSVLPPQAAQQALAAIRHLQADRAADESYAGPRNSDLRRPRPPLPSLPGSLNHRAPGKRSCM